MNPTYTFYYKRHRWLPWNKKTVVGHAFETFQNQMTGSMVLYNTDGTIYIIPNFVGKCYMKLGTDWLLAQKKQMEKEAGQPIQTAF
jgi:hypothetical protein